MKKITMNEMPFPAVTRLCTIYELLSRLEQQGTVAISSGELGTRLGVAAHNIRKDVSRLGIAGNIGSGYEVKKLKGLIAGKFGFGEEKKACVVGLGHLGSAIIQRSIFADGEFRIVAGFDSNINKLETIKTNIDLFPAYQITDVVGRKGIQLAIITVPSSNAQEVADRLVDGGIGGIVNFAPVVVKSKKNNVFVKNMDIAGELRILSALVKTAKSFSA